MYLMRLNGRDLPVSKLSLKIQQSKIPTFEAIVPLKLVGATPEELLFADTAIYEDGQLVIAGIVSGIPIPVLYDGNVGFLRIMADDSLGLLYLEEAVDLHFQNTNISAALTLLLATTTLSTWAVGDTSTLVNDPITVDVRNKETLWAQIQGCVAALENPTYVRYGGIVAGIHQLDLGSFGENNPDLRAVQGDNLIDMPKFKRANTDPIKTMRPISGKVGGAVVDLSRALNIQPGLAADPDYPLNAGSQTITNNTITVGVRVRKTFTTVKTSNASAPTDAERDEAALCLYYTAVREIKRRNPKTQCSFDVFLPQLPPVNDKIWVDFTVYERMYDEYQEIWEYIQTSELRGWFRITSVSAKITSNVSSSDMIEEQKTDGQIYAITVTDGDDADIYDANDVLFSKLDENELEDAADGITGVIWATSVDVTWFGVGGNCDRGGGAGPNSGRIFSFPMPTIPAGATIVDAMITNRSDSTTQWIVLTNAALPATNYSICSSGSGPANWGVGDNITYRATYVFR